MHLSQNVRGPLVLSYSSRKIHKHRLHFCQPHFLAISETLKIELRHFSNFTKKIRKTLGVNSEVLAANGKTNRPYHFNFLKAIFHKFYLVHSWILWPIYVFNLWVTNVHQSLHESLPELFLKYAKYVFTQQRYTTFTLTKYFDQAATISGGSVNQNYW